MIRTVASTLVQYWYIVAGATVVAMSCVMYLVIRKLLKMEPEEVPEPPEVVDDVPDQTWSTYGNDPKVKEYLERQKRS